MNQHLLELYQQSHTEVVYTCDYNGMPSVGLELDPAKFAHLILQELCNKLKKELIEDKILDNEQNPLFRHYLEGCNDGVVCAVNIIKNFGVEE